MNLTIGCAVDCCYVLSCFVLLSQFLWKYQSCWRFPDLMMRRTIQGVIVDSRRDKDMKQNCLPGSIIFGFDESHRMYYLNSMEKKMGIWIDHSTAQISRHNEHWRPHQQANLWNTWRWTENTSSPDSGLLKCTVVYFLSRLESLHVRVRKDNEMFNDEARCFCHGDRISLNYHQIYSIADLRTIIVDFASGLRQ
jgi:hypothetical protein